MTGDWGGKPDKRSINKEKPTNPNEELKKKIDDCWGRNTEGKFINKKLPDLEEIPGGKPTLYNWGLKSQDSQARHKM